jgi:hypothetical protein
MLSADGVKLMSILFRTKLWLQRQWTHFWPLLVLSMLFWMPVGANDPQTFQYHPSAFAGAVFGWAQHHTPWLYNNMESDWSILGLTIAIAIGLSALTLLASAIANNRRLVRYLVSQLGRPGISALTYQPRPRPAIMRLGRTGAARVHTSERLLAYDRHDLPAPLRLAHFGLFDRGYRREAWRLRHVYHIEASFDLPIDVPLMVLVPKHADSEQVSMNDLLGDTRNVVQLEGNFSDVFELYVARGYEQYALQILAPNVMLRLMRVASDTWIELHGRDLSLLRFGLPTRREELLEFEQTVQAVAETLGPYVRQQSGRINRESSIAHERFKPVLKRRLMISDRVLYGALAIFVVGLLPIVLISLFGHTADSSVNYISGGTVEYRTQLGDALEAFSFLLLALMFCAMIAGEIESRVRHRLWKSGRRRALRAHLLANSDE